MSESESPTNVRPINVREPIPDRQFTSFISLMVDKVIRDCG
jgi:hypothetical protein